jgi:hypothetical protein
MIIETSISIILIPTFLHYIVKYVLPTYNKLFPNVKKNKYLSNIGYSLQVRITRMKLLMRMFLGLFWIHAWIIIQLIKIMDFGTRLVFTLPDGLFSIPFKMRQLLTTSGQKLTILNAFTETECITNKFNLFLNMYWDTAGLDKDFSKNGFPRDKMRAIFGNVLLMVSYITGNSDTTFEDLAGAVKRIYVDLSTIKHINLDDEKDDTNYNVMDSMNGHITNGDSINDKMNNSMNNIMNNNINPYEDEQLFKETQELIMMFREQAKFTKNTDLNVEDEFHEVIPQLLEHINVR